MRSSICFIAVALAVAPLASVAQTNSYVPPTLVTKGTNVTPLTGDGSITVQVFIKPDGSFDVTRVMKSTNAADDAAALEVAKSSTYRPAMRDGKPVAAYYDYVINFASGQANAGVSGGSAVAIALLRQQRYAEAKTQLQAAVQSSPSDLQSLVLLGVANAYLNDAADAVAAFDRAGPIPPAYRAVAAQAYGAYASSLLSAAKNTDALAAAQKEVTLVPEAFGGYYDRGLAESNLGDGAAAIADLERARGLAQTAKVDDRSLATMEYNLLATQLQAGNLIAAAGLAKDVVRLDPAKQPQVDAAIASGYAQAAGQLVKNGKTADAVAMLESGASADPALAAPLYANAAMTMANVKSPNWNNVKVEADKALAADARNGHANFIAALALAQTRDLHAAQAAVVNAKQSDDYRHDANFARQVDQLAFSIDGQAPPMPGATPLGGSGVPVPQSVPRR